MFDVDHIALQFPLQMAVPNGSGVSLNEPVKLPNEEPVRRTFPALKYGVDQIKENRLLGRCSSRWDVNKSKITIVGWLLIGLIILVAVNLLTKIPLFNKK